MLVLALHQDPVHVQGIRDSLPCATHWDVAY